MSVIYKEYLFQELDDGDYFKCPSCKKSISNYAKVLNEKDTFDNLFEFGDEGEYEYDFQCPECGLKAVLEIEIDGGNCGECRDCPGYTNGCCPSPDLGTINIEVIIEECDKPIVSATDKKLI